MEHLRNAHRYNTSSNLPLSRCSNLASVKFCDEIASEAMRDWWNQCVHEKSLSTYSSLVRCSIPKRLGLIQVLSWRANIYDVLRRISTFSIAYLNAYFDSIDAKLSVYENLSEAPESLELAIPNNDIVQRVLSYY